MVEKVKAVARQFDDQFVSTIDEAREHIDNAINGVQEIMGRDKIGSFILPLVSRTRLRTRRHCRIGRFTLRSALVGMSVVAALLGMVVAI